jgi:hypothetical protein
MEKVKLKEGLKYKALLIVSISEVEVMRWLFNDVVVLLGVGGIESVDMMKVVERDMEGMVIDIWEIDVVAGDIESMRVFNKVLWNRWNGLESM